MFYSNTFAKIDMDAIAHNFHTIRRRAGARVMAVVKADAYGHGAVPVARQLLQEGCDFFGVSSIAEALELRNAGIDVPILLLGHTPKEAFSVAVEHSLRISVFDKDEAELLSREAQKQGKTVCVHIKLDTGMSRIGFQADEAAAETCAEMAKLPGICLEGLFSHFATADEGAQIKTEQQAERFAAFDQMLKDRGVDIPLRHLDNSAGIMRYGSHYEMVRAGIALYGLHPSDEVKPLLELRPAMSWYAWVSHVKCLEPGREISYGGTFVTQRTTVVATVSAGYADGYRRSLSNHFYVLIRGKKAPILGRVCMDQLVVDVTDIPDVQTGDVVVLMGSSGEETITAEQLGAAAGSFHYEQLCDLSRRVSRVYVKNGIQTDAVNYLLDK